MPEDHATDLEDLLHGQPTHDEVKPPVTPRVQALPFNELSWENFERLCTRLIASDGDIVDCHRYGKRGDYQAGIDILAHRRTAEGGLERWCYQCKRWQKMTSGDLHQIVNAFGFPADQYVVLVSFEAGANLRNVVADLLEVDLWDAEDISSQLKGQPELVEDFFGVHWQDVFCAIRRGKRIRPRTLNPFGDTGRITDPDRFFGREELLRQIFEELGKGVNLSLVGESQIGKSSLLSMVCVLGPKRMSLPPEAFIYLSLQWVDDEDDFYEELCKELSIETCRGGKLFRALRGKHYVLCLDEIEKMAWESFGFTVRVRSHMRGLADGPAAPLKLVIASRSPLAYLFPDSPELDSPLAGICRPLDVGPFSPDVARAFLSHRLRGASVTFTEGEITALLAETGGHPAKLQRAAADLYRRKSNLPESSELSGR